MIRAQGKIVFPNPMVPDRPDLDVEYRGIVRDIRETRAEACVVVLSQVMDMPNHGAPLEIMTLAMNSSRGQRRFSLNVCITVLNSDERRFGGDRWRA